MRLKERMKIELQRDISQISLQIIYCILFAGVVQVVYRLFAASDPYLDLFYAFPTQFLQQTRGRTIDGQTFIQRCVDASKEKLRRGGYIFFLFFFVCFFLVFFLVSGSSEKNCLGGFFICSKSITQIIKRCIYASKTQNESLKGLLGQIDFFCFFLFCFFLFFFVLRQILIHGSS